MRKYILLFLIIISFSTYSQSKYLGYRKDCFKMQEIKVKAILLNTMGEKKYATMKNLQHYNKKNMMAAFISIDSTGTVKKVVLLDYEKYLSDAEKITFEKTIKATAFDICIQNYENKDFTKEALFAETGTITFNITFPTSEEKRY